MKNVSMRDIADALGLSKNSVSLALRSSPQIPPATRALIARTARAMGYERNPALGRVMSMMRSKGAAGSLGTIAVINANQNRSAFLEHPTIPQYLNGCRRRAENLGYSIDTFWLYEEGLDGDRWLKILRSRGVLGVIFIGLMRQNRLPDFMWPVVNAYPCVVTGVRIREQELSFVCVDHYILTLRAFEKALSLGYRRPGLVLDVEIDELVDKRFSAGYRAGQSQVPQECRLEPFFDVVCGSARKELFRQWLERERPDVIFTLYNVVRHWLDDMKVSVPGSMGLIQLEWRPGHPEWAGMDQHNDLAGAAAVDMLTGMIHNGDSGVPQVSSAVFIGPTWVDGSTVSSGSFCRAG